LDSGLEDGFAEVLRSCFLDSSFLVVSCFLVSKGLSGFLASVILGSDFLISGFFDSSFLVVSCFLVSAVLVSDFLVSVVFFFFFRSEESDSESSESDSDEDIFLVVLGVDEDLAYS